MHGMLCWRTRGARLIEDITNPRQSASSMVKLATYRCWFMTDSIPQEELNATLAALCDSLRCGAYGTYCYGTS